MADVVKLIDRRTLLLHGAACGAGALLACGASAQGASLEVLAPVGAGRGSDQLARAVAEGLRLERLVSSTLVATTPGDDAQAIDDFTAGRRPSAGMMVAGLETIGALLIRRSKVEVTDARPLARLAGEGLALVTPMSSPLRSHADLAARMKSDPGSVRWGGRGGGGADRLLCILVARAAGCDPRALDYVSAVDGVAVSTKVLRGEVLVAAGPLNDLAQQIRGGTLRALALSSPKRSPDVDVPTFKELGHDVELVNWRGLVARPAMNDTLFERFGDAIDKLRRVQGWRQMLAQRFWFDNYLDADAFTRFIEDERDRVFQLLKSVGDI